MKKIIQKIKILEEDNIFMERLYYEYTTILHINSYLINIYPNESNINKKLIEQYR